MKKIEDLKFDKTLDIGRSIRLGFEYGEDDSLTLFVYGTDSRTDWKRNFQTSKKNFYGITAHSGWFEGAMYAFEEIKKRKELFDLLDKAKTIQPVGHSAGGPIAILLGYLLKRSGYPMAPEWFTMGCPPYLDRYSVVKLSRGTNITNFVYGNDAVAHLPSIPFVFDYIRPGYDVKYRLAPNGEAIVDKQDRFSEWYITKKLDGRVSHGKVRKFPWFDLDLAGGDHVRYFK